LALWCNSSSVNAKVFAVYAYLSKKEIIKDLITSGVIVCDEHGKLAENIKLGPGNQSDAFVRFRVEKSEINETAVWKDMDVYKSYTEYYLNGQNERDLCYVIGKEIPCTDKHPAKVRNTADKSKLISGNDESGFTFKGRFSNKNQAVSVGYETSQKAHNALRWLIDQQGYKNGEQVIVAWGTNNQKIPEILEDTEMCLFQENEVEKDIVTEKEFAKRLNNAIAGYACELNTTSEVIIMGLEAATTGRLSISYYKELKGDDFLNRIKQWHSTCIWRHEYRKVNDGFDEKGKPKYRSLVFIGAPSPKDIVLAAYGDKVSDKLKKATIERLLPCIIDGARLPYDLVNSAVNRASNPIIIEAWEYRKILTITCALIRKYKFDKFKEVWEMALDEKQLDRSYVFGRLLAIAQQIEEWALSIAGEKRDTNAERHMHQFKIHPYKTWGIITDKLRPYMSRLGSKGTHLTELMTQVNSLLSFEDFTSQKQLNDSFILGYYCQRQQFIEEKRQRIHENELKKLTNMDKEGEE